MKTRRKAEIESRLNQISAKSNAVFNLIFLTLGIICVLPVLFIFMISISSENSIRLHGYQVIPAEYSLAAYRFLLQEISQILGAFGISLLVMVIGTGIGLLLTLLLGYVLSRKEYKLRGFFTMVVFIPMIFNGGMVASYVVNTQLLYLGDTIWALILPLCVSSFHVIICRTYFQTTIPDSIMESAQIDGASEFTIFLKIILPLAKPMMATIALFLAFGYWGDWFQSSLYIVRRTDLYSLQALLDTIQRGMEMMANNPAAGVSLTTYKTALPKEGARMAMAILIIIPMACTYPFFQKYFISGLTVGAVKG